MIDILATTGDDTAPTYWTVLVVLCRSYCTCRSYIDRIVSSRSQYPIPLLCFMYTFSSLPPSPLSPPSPSPFLFFFRLTWPLVPSRPPCRFPRPISARVLQSRRVTDSPTYSRGRKAPSTCSILRRWNTSDIFPCHKALRKDGGSASMVRHWFLLQAFFFKRRLMCHEALVYSTILHQQQSCHHFF